LFSCVCGDSHQQKLQSIKQKIKEAESSSEDAVQVNYY